MQCRGSFHTIVDEIAGLVPMERSLVEERVWKEALCPGVSVLEDALKFGVNFHVYDDRMEQLYKEGYGYIFDTMVEWNRKPKQTVIAIVNDRIQHYLKACELTAANVLMLGDGCGNDTLHLTRSFGSRLKLHYFDVPDSNTFRFAQARFRKNSVKVEVICTRNALPTDFFDVIVCLEVLEHLPNPIEAITTIRQVLRTGGIALITESFSSVSPDFPTHLRSNARFAGRTPLLFLEQNLLMSFFNTNPWLRFRPMEFTKRERITFGERLKVIANKLVLRSLVTATLRERLSDGGV
jgi:SAM-dependent methyltransferase